MARGIQTNVLKMKHVVADLNEDNPGATALSVDQYCDLMDMAAQQQPRNFEAALVFDWLADEKDHKITFTKLKSACLEYDIPVEDRTLLQMIDLAEPGDKGEASAGVVTKEEFCQRVATIQKDSQIVELIRTKPIFDVQTAFPIGEEGA
jgi:hypothetical protein